jgi:hypothetical protein
MEFDLTDAEIDTVFKEYGQRVRGLTDMTQIDFGRDTLYTDREQNGIPVKHIQFPGLRKVGFLTYQDLETGQIYEDFKVDEEYKLSRENGDISIKWEWIPATYEVWKIGRDIYKGMGLAKGQLRDLSNLYSRKLNYYGAVYDATNSQPTSPMDRLVPFQYAYNVVEYRIQLLVNSDEGRKILMNINAVPSNNGMTMQQWQYLSKATPYMFYNPDEEGMTHQDVNTVAKVLDMSLVSDIAKYMQMLESIEAQAGKSIGVTGRIKEDVKKAVRDLSASPRMRL